jgi:hypothetical protein
MAWPIVEPVPAGPFAIYQAATGVSNLRLPNSLETCHKDVKKEKEK